MYLILLFVSSVVDGVFGGNGLDNSVKSKFVYCSIHGSMKYDRSGFADAVGVGILSVCRECDGVLR